MGWWQTRKSKKTLRNLGMSRSQANSMVQEMHEGNKQLLKQRDELRKLESPTYHRLINEINQIIDSDIEAHMKRQRSFKIVNEAKLSDRERADLLVQVEHIYQNVPAVDPEKPRMTIEELLKQPNVIDTTQPGTSIQITGYPRPPKYPHLIYDPQPINTATQIIGNQRPRKKPNKLGSS